jgi:TrmH family RNA methyltransferase
LILTREQRRRIDAIARGRSDEPLRVLEGPRAVLDAIRGGHVAEVWTNRSLDGALREELRSAADAAGVPVGEGAPGEFARLGGTVTPQGVLALVRDTAAKVEDLLQRPGMLLWLDRLQDPGNVGAVMRVAAAFDAAGVLAGAGSADPLGLKALRASAGLALDVPFARVDPADAATALRALGRPVWALDRGGDDLFGVGAAPRDVVLVVGGEGAGVGPEALGVAARRVGIPLRPGVDSLNAAVAAGIAVAVLRRRTG